MSSLSSGFDPAEVIESVEIGKVYPKRAVLSYLTGNSIADCFKDGSGSGEMLDCPELKILVEHYGLLPLGPPRAARFFGDHIIEAEIRRNTDDQVESRYNRVNWKKVTADESVGSAKASGGETQGEV